MPRLVGFSRFAALLEEQISEKISRRILSGDQGMVVWWSIGEEIGSWRQSQVERTHRESNTFFRLTPRRVGEQPSRLAVGVT